METKIYKSKIKSLALEDRPREKLLEKGSKYLTNAELIAILIRTGTKEENAILLAQKILKAFNNNIKDLAKADVNKLTQLKGIGISKAITIMAGIELGLRCHDNVNMNVTYIKQSTDLNSLMFQEVGFNNYEEFWVIYLSRSLKVIKKEKISEGGVAATVVDTKKIFKIAIDVLASSIALCHNHPSGNLTPSAQDIKLTKNIIKAGKMLDIEVIDHIIITENNYYSFADNGIL
ncbi:MAG: RadC family protein [Bacteroidales bacterium]|jgi:DNA repair protein RadC